MVTTFCATVAARINAFNESGENAAAVAPEISRFVDVLAVVSKINTWFTGEDVSDTITFLPSGETASTLPVTVGLLFVVGGVAAAVTAISPF